jgi:hypothetical protein
MVVGRAGAIRPGAGARNAAASHVIEFPRKAPGQFFAVAYVIGIPTDDLFDGRVPTVPHAPGPDARP